VVILLAPKIGYIFSFKEEQILVVLVEVAPSNFFATHIPPLTEKKYKPYYIFCLLSKNKYIYDVRNIIKIIITLRNLVSSSGVTVMFA